MDSIKYGNVLEYVRNKVYPVGFTKQEKLVLRKYCKKFEFDPQSNALFYLDKAKDGSSLKRLVVSEEEREKVFQECHSANYAGHAGRDNTLKKIKQRYYWPEYYKDTVEMIKRCDRCQRNTSENKCYDVLHPVKVIPKVWYLVGIDLLDAPKTSQSGNVCLLTQTDYFTKYVEGIPLPDKTALSVAKALYSTYCRHGAPVHIISDQGREFVNQVTEILFSKFGVHHRMTSAYHPQSNGLDERTNQSVRRTLRKVMEDKEDRWDDYIEGALFTINTNESTTTKYSPFYLMFGRKPRLPFEVDRTEGPLMGPGEIATLMDDLGSEEATSEHVTKMSQMRDSLFPVVDDNIKQAQEKQKQQYMKRKGQFQCPFKVGDLVLQRNMLQMRKAGHKLEDQWLGPYHITELNTARGVCRLTNGYSKKLAKQVSVKQLKPYKISCNMVSPEASAQSASSNDMPKTHPQLTPVSDVSVAPPPLLIPPVPKPRTKFLTRPIPVPRPNINKANITSTPPKQTAAANEKKPMPSPLIKASAVEKERKEKVNMKASSPKKPLSTDDLTTLDQKIINLQPKQLEQLLQGIRSDLNNILTSQARSWRFEVFKGTSGISSNLKKADLPFNVCFGAFTEEQQDVILKQLWAFFPLVHKECLLKVLLPEALIHLCMVVLKIPFQTAEDYLQNGGRHNVEEVLNSLKKRVVVNNEKKRPSPKMSTESPKKMKLFHSPTETTDADCIFVKEEVLDAKSAQAMKRPNYQVEESDIKIIKRNEWLNDTHIGKAQNLLQTQFPHVEGLQSTTLGSIGQFEIVKGQFVQILHTGASHWLCISNMGCTKDNAVNLYDSMHVGVNKFTKKQIAALLHIQTADEIEIFVKPVTYQGNGVDCGVYAIAFATALCYGHDPSMLIFKRRDIRNHLWKCFTQENLEMFPCEARSSPIGPIKKLRVPIYCECRLPFDSNEDDMVECNKCCKWYHKNCQKVPDKVFQRKKIKWQCQLCDIKS